MLLRQAGVDISVIALWLGHESIESTQIYLHADLALKQRALDRTAPLGADTGRYRPPTTCSPSSTASDYAEQPTTRNQLTSTNTETIGQLGIIRGSG